MDFLIVPTVGFRLLFVLVTLRHARRRLISLSVTDHPTADWIARQVTDAFPWDEAPDYIIRDRDGCYGQAVTKRLTAMGIRDQPILSGPDRLRPRAQSRAASHPVDANPAPLWNALMRLSYFRILGAILVREGLAWAFVRHSQDYVDEEALAKRDGLGVHRHGCVPAWEWRAAQRQRSQ